MNHLFTADKIVRPARLEVLDEAFGVAAYEPFCPMLFGAMG